MGQSWYLDESWLPTVLVDSSVPDQEREAVAQALYSTPRPDNFKPRPIAPLLSKQPVHTESYWPEDGSLPSLAPMVGQRTWHLFSILKMQGEEVEWLQQPAVSWRRSVGFWKLSVFLKYLSVVNDSAERGVKLIQVQFEIDLMCKMERTFLLSNYIF